MAYFQWQSIFFNGRVYLPDFRQDSIPSMRLLSASSCIQIWPTGSFETELNSPFLFFAFNEKFQRSLSLSLLSASSSIPKSFGTKKWMIGRYSSCQFLLLSTTKLWKGKIPPWSFKGMLEPSCQTFCFSTHKSFFLAYFGGVTRTKKDVSVTYTT